jgi:hypothetical protein
MRKALVAVLVCGLSTNALADEAVAPPGLTPASAIDHPALAPTSEGPPEIIVVQPDPSARKPAIVLTAITGVLLATTVAVYFHRQSIAKVRTLDDVGSGPCDAACFSEQVADQERRQIRIDREKKIYVGTAIAAVITGGAAGYFWSKATEKSFRRAPRVAFGLDDTGASLAMSGSF